MANGDVIILASGQRVVPAQMEHVIRSSDLVRDVVMFGQGRGRVGVLIEPANQQNDLAEFRDQIWTKVEEANNLFPAEEFCHISKVMILITKDDKPMNRATGAVQPETTLKDYEAEIENLYDRPSAWTPEDVEQWLLQHALAAQGVVDPNTDLFLQGFNSLGVTRLREKVLNALKYGLDPRLQNDVPRDLIYRIPIIRKLSSWITSLVNEGATRASELLNEQQKQAIDDMIRKYSIGFPRPYPAGFPIEPAVVLLTGSTGGLGSSLLSELVRSDKVQRVFAFNRPSTQPIKERQSSAFSDRGLSLDLLDSHKITYVEADASQDKCGLSAAQYEEMQRSVTVIIHNAWRVDFNLAISSFEDCIRASRNLIELGLTSSQSHILRFLFTSSIASASSWDDSQGPFPEEVQLDPSVAVGTGYGASKYVTERIITSSGLCATSLRIGQITGTYSGCWNTTDWFPILVTSSESLAKLPRGTGVVSWVDEEYVVSAILDTAFAQQALPPALNLVNPESQRFDEVVELVQKATIEEKHLREDELPIIESSRWLELLRENATDPSDYNLQRFPAIKLLEFMHTVLTEPDDAEVAGMKCSIDKMKEVSRTVRESCCRVGKRKAGVWVKYWIKKGVL